MTQNLQQVADDARRLLHGFKAIETVAQAFEDVAILQRTQAEAEKRLARTREQITAAEGELQAAQFSASEINRQTEQTKADTIAKATATVEEAQAQAAGLIEAAKAEAAEIVTKANKAKDAIDTEVALARDALDVIKTETDAYEAKLDKVQKQVAKLFD